MKHRTSRRELFALRRSIQVLASRELHSRLAAVDTGVILPSHHLEGMLLLRDAVRLGGAEQSDVVGLVEVLHQRRHEVLRRRTAPIPVFRRQNDVKATVGIDDLPLCLQPAQRGADARDGLSQSLDRLFGGEVVPALRC